MSLNIVILAAGSGKRMQSALPKVLHPIAGKPMLAHLIETVQQLKPEKILVVCGHGAQQVQAQLQHLPVQWVEQKEQLGTAHALMQALPYLEPEAQVIVMLGDTPMIQAATLQKLLGDNGAADLNLLTAEVPNPFGLGRIVRDANNNVLSIVEEKDATAAQRLLQEINTGVMAAPATLFRRWLPLLKNHNAQQEYYLTDVVALAVEEHKQVNAIKTASYTEAMSVNDRVQLAALERIYQREQAERLMLAGVTIKDPARFDLRGTAQIAADVTIDINVVLEGDIFIAANTYIGANVILKNVKIGANVNIKENTIIEDAVVEDNCEVGPFARIRPNTVLRNGAHIGNFAEIKNSEIGAGTKIHHVSYTGDATIGEQVNIGAGNIICNYDGVNKYKTTIGNHAFIGSNSSLIAPINIGNHATVGAGSAIRGNIPANALAVTRAEQRIIDNWRRPTHKKPAE